MSHEKRLLDGTLTCEALAREEVLESAEEHLCSDGCEQQSADSYE